MPNLKQTREVTFPPPPPRDLEFDIYPLRAGPSLKAARQSSQACESDKVLVPCH
jgi:hypothetical protein